MSLNSTSALHRQVTAVRRRLFLQTLIRALAWGWFAALALSAVWFLAEPLLLSAPPAWLRWAVLGGSVAAGTAVAVAIAVMRRPSIVQAALALDEQFRLKERVTTSLLLRPDEAASPAGAALLADANQRVDPLRVGDRFPVRVPWTAALVPASAAALALLIWLYHPDFGQAHGPTPPAASNNDLMKAEIDKVTQQVRKAKQEAKKEDAPKPEELKRIEADIDKMLSNPHETKDQVREDIKKGDEILDDLKKQDQARADEERALKERLEELERARQKKEQKPGDDPEKDPAKDLNKALDQGDMAQAQREADELAKKLEANQEADELKKKVDEEKDPQKKQELQDELKKKEDEGLNDKDRAKLNDELKDLKDEADELTRKNEEEQKKKDEDAKKLDEEAKKDGADKDELQKEKEQLQKEKEELKQQEKQLQDLSNNLNQAQQAMQQGKDGQAAQQLQQAGDKMGQLSGEGEKKAIDQDAKQVQQLKKGLSQGLAKQEAEDAKQAGDKGDKPGDKGGKPGDKGGDKAGDKTGKPGDQPGNAGANPGGAGNQPGNGPNPIAQPGQGTGARPEGDDKKTGEEEHKVGSEPDDKAPLEVVDKVDGPHDRFTGPKNPDEMKDELRRAAQEGAAASDHERLTDKGAADMAKGFFEKMRPPDKGDDKAPAPPK